MARDDNKRGRKIDYEQELVHVSEIDWARLAAYLDGEGNLRLNAEDHKWRNNGMRKIHSTRYRCIIRVTNTDVRLTDWCQRTFGGVIVFRDSQDPRWRDSSTWHAIDGRAEYILRRCLPHFILKREQAEIMLAFRATYTFRNAATGGRRDPVNGRLATIDPVVHAKRKELASQLKQLTRRGRRDALATETIQ